MGAIGRSKFCLKPRAEKGKEGLVDCCVVLAHESNKFHLESNGFYLKENDSKAFMQPVFIKENLLSEMTKAILQ
jgi:hypothetical protein